MPPRRQHPFELALVWRRELEGDPTLSQAKIAAREGISRARVTQIKDLVKLPAEIQSDLLHRPPSIETRCIPERRLRALVRDGDEATQIRHWRELLKEFGGPEGK